MNVIVSGSSRIVRRLLPVLRIVRFINNDKFQSSMVDAELSTSQYEKLSTEMLDKLADVFDCLGEKYDLGDVYDVHHDYGVLKVEFGAPVGTYIINRQAPNKQLWLSSPRSGPKRYDYVAEKGEWVYKHDGTALHSLLNREISEIICHPIEFPKN